MILVQNGRLIKVLDIVGPLLVSRHDDTAHRHSRARNSNQERKFMIMDDIIVKFSGRSEQVVRGCKILFEDIWLNSLFREN